MTDITKEQIQQMIKQELDNREYENQYKVTPIAFHRHTASDSTQLDLQDFNKLGMSKGAYFTQEINNGVSGSVKIIDWTIGNKQKLTTTASCTLTFVNPNGPCNLILRFVHTTNASAYTYTYPATVKWPSGTKPTTTNTSGAVDIIAFYFDGVNYWGTGILNFS